MTDPIDPTTAQPGMAPPPSPSSSSSAATPSSSTTDTGVYARLNELDALDRQELEELRAWRDAEARDDEKSDDPAKADTSSSSPAADAPPVAVQRLVGSVQPNADGEWPAGTTVADQHRTFLRPDGSQYLVSPGDDVPADHRELTGLPLP